MHCKVKEDEGFFSFPPSFRSVFHAVYLFALSNVPISRGGRTGLWAGRAESMEEKKC